MKTTLLTKEDPIFKLIKMLSVHYLAIFMIKHKIFEIQPRRHPPSCCCCAAVLLVPAETESVKVESGRESQTSDVTCRL